MDAVELLTILERSKLDHLARVADYERRERLEDATRHSIAFAALDKVTTAFASSSPEAAELVDNINTLVMNADGHELFEGTAVRDQKVSEDLTAWLRDELNNGLLS